MNNPKYFRVSALTCSLLAAVVALPVVAQDEVGQTTDQAEIILMTELRRGSERLLEGDIIERRRVVFGDSGFVEMMEYEDVVRVPTPASLSNPLMNFPDPLFIKRPTPPSESAKRQIEADTGMTAENLSDFSRVLGMGSLNIALGEGENLPMGIHTDFFDPAYEPPDDASFVISDICESPVLSPYGSEPDESRDPDVLFWGLSPAGMMMGQACFLRKGAESFDRMAEGTTESTQTRAEDLQYAAGQVEYVGITDFLPPPSQGGRTTSNDETTPEAIPAYHLCLNDLEISQVTDGQESTINSVCVWIDTEHYVRRKMRIEGVMEAEGQTREFFLEKILDDYRDVPNSNLYEPYREVLRMGGVLDAAQKAEMQDAMVKLEEFDRQMASMPASQRAMMEKMMGPKIEQMHSMVNGGAVEIEIITNGIVINPTSFGSQTEFNRVSLGDDLVQRIQIDLTTLGYEPGNTSGDLTQQTVTAIVKFESDNGMDVTGQPTPQLAAALAAAVERQN